MNMGKKIACSAIPGLPFRAGPVLLETPGRDIETISRKVDL